MLREIEITVRSDDALLAGTLCLPRDDGISPCVLMVHGSGPLDRDENARELKLNVFNTMAHHLASKGIASLRYDKRGCGRSSGDYWNAGFHDFVRDAKAVHQYLSAHDAIDKKRMFLLGHSEGTLIAQLVSLDRDDIGGLVLISPTVQRLQHVLTYQASKVKEDVEHRGFLTRCAFKLLWRLSGDPHKGVADFVTKVRSSDAPSFTYMGKKTNARWFRELFDYEPADTTRHVRCPILAIVGEKDVQVDPGDTLRIRELAQGEAETHMVPNLTHILRLDEQRHSIFRYKKLVKRDIDRSILEIMSNWLEKRIQDS